MNVCRNFEVRATKQAVKKALADITECVRTKQGNLLDLAVKAAGLRASLGEISDACEEVVGRYKAVIRTISGVYSSETKNDPDFLKARAMTEEFAKREGRQPRIMIAKMGQDGHDAVRKWLLPAMPTVVLMSIWGRCSRLRQRLHGRLLRTTYMCLVFHHWLPVTKLWCPR